MSTNDIADWDATLNDAIDRCDTPAICRSRLNRIQCLFNFYSVDSAIIEARESLPFILNAKQYSFYFSTYNTFISGLFKQRRFDEAREEATTMFETAQQVKQPVGMTMALQVQGSMYYKLGLYDQALTSLEKGIAICPTYENGENQVLYISAVLYEWLFMTALKVNDTERISRYADSYAALVKWRDEHGKVDPTGHYPVTSRSLQALSFLKKGQIKEARRLLDEAARFMIESAKAFGRGKLSFLDKEEFARIKELYGCTGTPNEGLRIDPMEQARRIREAEQNDPLLKGRVILGVADPAIFDESRGESIADMQEKSPNFLHWMPGDHTRLAGKMQFHYRLAFGEDGRPMLQVFNTCKHFIRTIPNLVYDESNVEDIDTTQEDHIYDECRYVLMENPISAAKHTTPPPMLDDPLDMDPRKDKTRFMRI